MHCGATNSPAECNLHCYHAQNYVRIFLISVLQCWMKCCWDKVSSYFSAVLVCELYVSVIYDPTMSSALLFWKCHTNFMVYYTFTVNIIDKTCKQTISDICLPIPTGWLTWLLEDSDNDSKSSEEDCSIWVTLSLWSVNESPSLGWRHVVLCFWSSTPCSVHGGAISWGIAPQVGSSRVRFLMSLEFFRHNPSRRTMALGLTQPLTEMSIRNVSWG